MAVFFITTPNSPPDHRAEVDRAVMSTVRHLKLADGQWLVASAGTSGTVSESLGITGKPDDTSLITRYPTLIFQVSNYYGRGNPEVWDWIKTNWEATSRG